MRVPIRPPDPTLRLEIAFGEGKVNNLLEADLAVLVVRFEPVGPHIHIRESEQLVHTGLLCAADGGFGRGFGSGGLLLGGDADLVEELLRLGFRGGAECAVEIA